MKDYIIYVYWWGKDDLYEEAIEFQAITSKEAEDFFHETMLEWEEKCILDSIELVEEETDTIIFSIRSH